MSLARINYSTFAARKGASIKCEVDGAQIQKGEKYLWFKVGFRARYKHVRCTKTEHFPRNSARESSMLADAYSAIEEAEDLIAGLQKGDPEDNADSIEEGMTAAADQITGVADQYSEAMDAMGAAGEGGDMEERRDSLTDFADTLSNWSPDEDEPDYDLCTNVAHDAAADEPEHIERGDIAECEECAGVKADWWVAILDSANDALSEAQF